MGEQTVGEDTPWELNLLGRFELRSTASLTPKFRSRSAAILLAYLAIHEGREVARLTLQDAIWAGSDGDKQAQNLRKALSDLRDVLESEVDRGTRVKTLPEAILLSEGFVRIDASEFRKCAEAGLKNDDEPYLRKAAGLYEGSLLRSWPEEWVSPFRAELEEFYTQVIESLVGVLVSKNDYREAIRLARKAVLLAPMREEVHIALMQAYKAGGMEVEAVKQYEVLETFLMDTWGEEPSARAKLLLEEPSLPMAVQRPIIASRDDFDESGGAVPLSSPLYIERQADAEARRSLGAKESIILIQGPRQVGKTSLLARVMQHARTQGTAIVFSDFQLLGDRMDSDESFYRVLAYSFASQTGINLDLGAIWNAWLGPNMNLDSIVESLLCQVDRPVCWAIDEVDILFGRPYAKHFFGLLRSWHNRRALEPDGPWAKLTLILTYASEAHLFITDINQSPFNVGVRVPLRDFTLAEVQELASRYDAHFDSATGAQVFELTNGHPHLCRKAFASIKSGQTIDGLKKKSSLEDGPFGAQLRHILDIVAQNQELVAEVINLLEGRPVSSPTIRHRLWAAGVLKMNPDGAWCFRVPIYQTYLATHLASS